MADYINYRVTKDLESEGRSDSFMDVGIHENVELTKVEYGKTDNGNEFLAFYFVNPANETLSHTEWKPRAKDAEKLESAVINQMKRVKQIVTKFVPQERFEFNASSFKEFADNVIRILGNDYKGKKVRIKVVYSGKYTSLPNYSKFQFIESMDVPKEKSKIKMLSIDKVTREDTPDPTQTVNSNPFVNTVTNTDTSVSSDKDLPF
jgi:hypothetical protein